MSAVRRDKPVRLIVDPIFFGILFLLVWAAIPVVFDLHELILPGPLAIGDVLLNYSSVLMPAMLNSLSLLAIGFGIGVVLGVGLAAGLFYAPRVRQAIYPFLVMTFVVPKAVFIPLLLLWFGTGDFYKIVIVVTMVFFPVLENTLAGFRGVQSEMIELSRSLKASEFMTLTKIRLPAAMPNMLAGIKLGMAEAFIGIVLAELLAPTSGIGSLIMNASRSTATTFVVAGIAYIALFGLAAYFIFDWIEKRLTSWQY
jgi:NitT/TauT family transport system permease protein